MNNENFSFILEPIKKIIESHHKKNKYKTLYSSCFNYKSYLILFDYYSSLNKDKSYKEV